MGLFSSIGDILSYGVDDMWKDALGGGGDKYSAPIAPQWEQQIPEALKNYFPDMLAYLNSLKGGQLQMPAEYDLVSQQLQSLLGFQPSITQIPEPSEYGQASQYLQNYLNNPPSFNYPMQDIMKALEAQQALQYQDYLEQIRPIAARQGQLDSSAYTNAIGKYLQGQQSTSYNRIADLLTQQALTNLGIQQTLPGVAQGLSGIGAQRGDIQRLNAQMQYLLPQYQSGILSQLQNLGTAKTGINEFNLQYPYSSYIPAMSNLYGQGMNYAGQQYQSEMVPYNQEMQIQLANKAASDAQQQQLMGMLGSLALSAGTGGLGAMLSGGSFLTGAGGALTNMANPSYLNLSNLFSQSGQTLSPQLQSLNMNTPSSVYNPSWGNYNNPYGNNNLRIY